MAEDKCYNIMCKQNDSSFPHSCKASELIDFCDAVVFEPSPINNWLECQNIVSAMKAEFAKGITVIEAKSKFGDVIERLG